MLKKVHKLLSEADAVVHYNGTKFDIPTLNKEFLLYNIEAPAPYKQIDLLKTAKKQFRFPSNKLDFIAQALGVGRKYEHRGHTLWARCMDRDPQAWAEMELYNKQDVLLLEKVYQRLLPWVHDHANYSLYDPQGLVCPNCGGADYQRRGFAFTKTAKYTRYQCKCCGHWFRGGKSQAPGPEGKFVSL
jgi:DNA polymerase elongation subunit (family B)